jgi:hypothetical protein
MKDEFITNSTCNYENRVMEWVKGEFITHKRQMHYKFKINYETWSYGTGERRSQNLLNANSFQISVQRGYEAESEFCGKAFF